MIFFAIIIEVKKSSQCLVYQFQCNRCDAGYVGYTRGHLHERVDGHKQKSSSICKHYFSEQNSDVSPFLSEQFHVLTKGSNKFDCLIKEMLFTRKLKPSLNVLVCYTAGFSVVTQRSSPQTAAENRTTFLSLCVCGLTNKPIMYKKFDNT